MSNVTNLIISFSIIEDEISRINEVNLFHNNGLNFEIKSANFEEEKKNVFGKESENRWYGGSKKLETPLYIGAFNNLDLRGLIKYCQKIEWIEPENVQIIVKEQDSDKFIIETL